MNTLCETKTHTCNTGAREPVGDEKVSGCTSARVSASTMDTPAKGRDSDVGSTVQKHAFSGVTTAETRALRNHRRANASFQGVTTGRCIFSGNPVEDKKVIGCTSARVSASTMDTPAKPRV